MNEPEAKISVAALYEGTYSVGTDRKFIRIKKTDNPAKGALKISLNPFLIKSGDRNILIDAGPGFFGPEDHYRWMKDNLVIHSLTPDDITDVFCSHLHSDHIGGLIRQENDRWVLTFPNAQIWVSADDWEYTREKDLNDENPRGRLIRILNEEARLNMLNDGDRPYPEISIEVIGGHTPASLCIYFEAGDQKYLMAGDVLASSGSVNRKYAARYDYDGRQSMKMREKLTEKAWKEGFVILAYHDNQKPMFRLTAHDKSGGYTIKSAGNAI